MKQILRIALFATALMGLVIYFAACGSSGTSQDKGASAIYGPGTAATLNHTAPLIAGAGQGFVNGGGPGGAQQCGWVTFTGGPGNAVTVTYDLDNGWYFNGNATANMHLHVSKAGATLPKTMAPGQFHYTGMATPDVSGQDGTLTTAATLTPGVKYNFAAHASVYHIEQVEVPCLDPEEGEDCTLALVNADEDGHVTFGMYQGPDNNPQGNVDMWLDSGNLYVAVTSNTCDLVEAQMHISADVPDSAAGQWDFNSASSGQAIPCGWQFGPIPLSTLDIVPSCDENCEGSGLSGLNFAIHMSDEVDPQDPEEHESSTGWTEACRVTLDDGGTPDDPSDDHWKSYDSCVLSFECVGGDLPPQDGPCYEDVRFDDTAYGFDNTADGEPDATAANEAGWFKKFGYNNWGWFIQILR